MLKIQADIEEVYIRATDDKPVQYKYKIYGSGTKKEVDNFLRRVFTKAAPQKAKVKKSNNNQHTKA